MEHAEDADIDAPLNYAVSRCDTSTRVLPAGSAAADSKCHTLWLALLQSPSQQQESLFPETALGLAAAGQSVMGVPSDMSHVMHPDGLRTPAMFVDISADCKVLNMSQAS